MQRLYIHKYRPLRGFARIEGGLTPTGSNVYRKTVVSLQYDPEGVAPCGCCVRYKHAIPSGLGARAAWVCGLSVQTDFFSYNHPCPSFERRGFFGGVFFALVPKVLREPHVGAKRAKHRAKHERAVLRSKNKGTKCTFVVSEPQHQLWVQWGMWRPCEAGARPK